MLDMSDLFIVVSLIAGLVAFWVMQCTTRHAGFTDDRAIKMQALRFSLAMLGLALFGTAYSTAMENYAPDAAAILVRIALICLLGSLPYAFGGQASGSHR